MNSATKRLAGRWYSSSGGPYAASFPFTIKATRSAIVSASS